MPDLLSFLRTYWGSLLIGAIVGGLGGLLLLAKADARHWEKVAGQEKAAHVQTVANYRAAAVEAARLDAVNVSRVKAEQAAITERISDEYEDKLSNAADRYDRLRAKAAAYLGSPAPADVPDTRDATCRAVAGTGCDAIPALLKAAQDNTDQLIALQAWTRAQAAVDFR